MRFFSTSLLLVIAEIIQQKIKATKVMVNKIFFIVEKPQWKEDPLSLEKKCVQQMEHNMSSHSLCAIINYNTSKLTMGSYLCQEEAERPQQRMCI